MEITSNYSSSQTVQNNKEEKEYQTTNSFSNIMDETSHKQENKKDFEKEWKLIEDIKSVMKTGLTVEELERLEELIQKLKTKVKESSGNDPEENKAINQSITELEQAIMAIKKRISGEAVIDAGKDDKNPSKNKEMTNKDGETKTDSLGFMERLNNLSKEIEKLKDGQEKLAGMIHNNDRFKLVKDMREFEERNLNS